MRKYLEFIAKCILVSGFAILIVSLLNKPYKKMDDEGFLDVQKFPNMEEEYPEKIQIANIGSSHGLYDFNYSDLRGRGYICFNYAGASQTFEYDLALLKEYGGYLEDDAILFIPISYFSFNNETINSSEAQAMSIRYYHCMSPEYIPGYDPFVDLVSNRYPVLTAGPKILKLIPGYDPSDLPGSISRLFDSIGEDENASVNEGINADVENSELTDESNEGDVEESAPLEPTKDVGEFASRAYDRYSRHFDNKESLFLPEREEELREIIEWCSDNNITPVMITPPYSCYYRENVSEDFLNEFYSTINEICQEYSLNYYDYSADSRFNDDIYLFNDSDHLNDEGGAIWMKILEEEIPELREVISSF